ncbi:immunoglobulin E-set, partial [Powellomyces hirtus]
LQRITFRWHHSAASKVVLTGTFDDWAQSITMPRDPNCRDEFCVTLVLDRLVRHEFKFVVDGEWRCSYAFPTVFDSNGFVNNV